MSDLFQGEMSRRDFLTVAAALGLASTTGLSLAEDASTPWVTLKPGEKWFRFKGKTSFLLGRNPVGKTVEAYTALFKEESEAGGRIARIHVIHGVGSPVPAPPGKVDETWASNWDKVFENAAKAEISVLPVFGVWGQWNDSPSPIGDKWSKNPYSAALGGPGKQPSDLFKSGSETQKLWLDWLHKLIVRWQSRPNIFGWEIFSELDNVSGYTPANAVAFVDAAAKIIRDNDKMRRPITASMGGITKEPLLFKSGALDFIEIHPYANAFAGNLDEMLVQSLPAYSEYGKPIVIGESGLNPLLQAPETTAPASVGIHHAIWAGAVCGTLNGRSLWFEDGYDMNTTPDPGLTSKDKDAGKLVAEFVKDVDYSGFGPIKPKPHPALVGAAIGNEKLILGWFRDKKCAAPSWPIASVTGQSVELETPGTAAAWKVDFYNTSTCKVFHTDSCKAQKNQVTVPLPPFDGAVAFKMRPA